MKIAVMSFAHGHAEGYLRRLMAVADVEVIATDPDAAAGDLERGSDLAARLGVRYVQDYATALAEKPDGVVICSENSRHRALIEEAAVAGAAILCEKPLATSIEDAQAALDVVERAGATLMVAYPVRFSPVFTALTARVRSGGLGEILSIVGTNNGKLPRDRAWFTDPELAGGGAIIDHVVHCADLIDALIPQRAVAVHAVSNRILHPEVGARVETAGLVTIDYEDGIMATIDCSWSQPESAETWGGLTLEVTGTRGSVRISPFASHLGGYQEDGAAWVPYGADLDAAMIEEFLAGIRERRPVQPDGPVGLRTFTIAAAALESASAGIIVRL